ncbi:MAG: hypothetical protein ACE5ER_08395 [Nitrospinaceae bacterium]
MTQDGRQRKSRLIQQVLVRRDGTVLGEYLTRDLVSEIREGRLLPADEFSGDGDHWIRFDRHHQLSRLFEHQTGPHLPGLDRKLETLASLLRDLNQGE